MWYPKAIAHSATVINISTELTKAFAWVGIPKEILTNQGANYTSTLIGELCDVLKIKAS